MAFVINDRVKETSTTTGTGTLNLAGAQTGFETFVAGIGNTNTTYYAIFNQGTAEFEVGIGTVTDATPDTLSRIQLFHLLMVMLQLILLVVQKMFSVLYLRVKQYF